MKYRSLSFSNLDASLPSNSSKQNLAASTAFLASTGMSSAPGSRGLSQHSAYVSFARFLSSNRLSALLCSTVYFSGGTALFGTK